MSTTTNTTTTTASAATFPHPQDAFGIARHFLKTDEGCRLRPYWCTSGYLTIGYGHNLGVWADPATRSAVCLPHYDTLTLDEAGSILERDIDNAISVADAFLGKDAPALMPVRAAVLVCMAFQMGPRLHSFRRMREAIRASDVDATVAEMLDSRWARRFPARAHKYAQAYRTGKLPE